MFTNKSRRTLGTVIFLIALTVIFAVSALASYSVDFYGRVTGLEEGTSYTVAKYSFANDSYGEFTALTDSTQLTVGVWGIKSENAQTPEVIFVDGSESGKVSFWDNSTNAVDSSVIGGKNDSFVQGKWTYGSCGAYTRLIADAMSSGTVPTLCFTLDKSKFLTPNADGEYTEAVPFEGENNLLQETYFSYGFKEEQIIPASKFKSITFPLVTVLTHGLQYTSGYTVADQKGRFVFIVKNIGEEGYTEYSTQVSVAHVAPLTVNAPAEMANSEGYLVALRWEPYADSPDDIFSSNSNSSKDCYVHIGFYKGENGAEYEETVYPAPEVYDGFGIIGADPDLTYEIAPVSIKPDGSGFDLGSWTEYTYSASRERNLVGLWAVRYAYNNRHSAHTFAYAYGDNTERANILDLNQAGTHLSVCTDLSSYNTALFYHGMWSGDVCSSVSLGKYTLFNHSQSNWADYLTAKKALDALGEGEDKTAAQKAVDAALASFLTKTNNIKYKYAFDREGVIKTSEAGVFSADFKSDMWLFYTKNITTKIKAYVADKNGGIATYEASYTQPYSKSFSVKIDFGTFLPAEGYLVAFEVYPCTDNTVDNVVGFEEGGSSYRVHMKLNENSYTIDTPAELPSTDDRPWGLVGEVDVISGLNKNLAYEYAQYSIHGIPENAWKTVPKNATQFTPDLVGVIAVKYAGDGYSHSGSAYSCVYLPGSSYNNILHLTETLDKNGNTISVVDVTDAGAFADNRGIIKFNQGRWTGIKLTNSLALNYGFDPLILGSTNTPYPASFSTAIKNATTDAEMAKAQAEAEKGIADIYYSYEYTPDEVIPMSDFVSMDFGVVLRQTSITLTGGIQTRFVFKVVTENGDLVDRVVYKDVSFKQGTHTKVNIALSDFDDTTGYIVGIVIHPFAKLTEGSAFVHQDTDGTDINVYLYKDGYKAKKDLMPAARPKGLKLENKVLSGLDANIAYEYANYYITGADEWSEIPLGTTELGIDKTGLIAVRIKGDGVNYESSAPVLFYIYGSRTARETLGVITDSKPAFTKDTNEWTRGVWTGDYLSWVLQTAGAYSFLDQKPGVTSTTVQTLWLYQVTRKEAEDALEASESLEYPSWMSSIKHNPSRLQGVIDSHYSAENYEANLSENISSLRNSIAEAMAERNIMYAYDETEIIPVDELLSMSFVHTANQIGLKLYDVKSKVVYHVMDANGNITKHTWTSQPTDVLVKKSWVKLTVDVQEIADLPTEGWIVGVEFYPYAEMDADRITAIAEPYLDADNVAYAFTQHHINMGYYYNEYKIAKTAPDPVEQPVITIAEKGGVLKIENYNAELTYVYSADGGASWTRMSGDSLVVTKASTEYIVKSLANSDYFESAPSEPALSPALVVVGSSLVLDGEIGMKVYMDIDTELISSLHFYMTKKNYDFEEYADSEAHQYLYQVSGTASLDEKTDWTTKVTLDEESGLYYLIAYVPAKDLDNVKIECDIGAYMKDNGQRVSFNTLDNNFSFSAYLNKAKELAQAGDSDFIRALELINELANYTAYADNYFAKGALDDYSAKAVITAEEERITDAELDGVCFYGTSLLLENKITIRHYFEVTDLSAFEKAYTCDTEYGIKGDYIYFDIADIPAQDIGKLYTLTINGADGFVYEIKYSVANYIKSMTESADNRLVSLVNAMYDYYVEAERYANPKPMYLKYDANITIEGAQGGLNIYIPTEEGYIDHTYVHTVSTERNSDMWRLSLAYICDDNLENAAAITTPNAEWDMALKISGRPDFIGGWAHGDEKMTDIKFYVDGVETDITKLTQATEFKTMKIVENSKGYDPSDSTVHVLNHYKEYTVTHAGIRLEQRVEWLGEYNVEHSYLAMMPPSKAYTDAFYTNKTEPQDLDLAATGTVYVDDATSVTVYGKESGVYCTMTVNDYDLYNAPYMSIADNGGGGYNKMYFTFVKNGTVSKGDIWETFTHYRIQNK